MTTKSHFLDQPYGAYYHREVLKEDEELTRVLKAPGKRVEHEGMTMRSLHHFHASVVIQKGQNIVVVSKRLGHANVSVTSDIYAHSLPGW